MKTPMHSLRRLIREVLEDPLTAAGLDEHEKGITLAALEDRYPEAEDFYGSTAYRKLLSYYRVEMPYGTQKGRTGDPDVWILDRLESEGIGTK